MADRDVAQRRRAARAGRVATSLAAALALLLLGACTDDGGGGEAEGGGGTAEGGAAAAEGCGEPPHLVELRLADVAQDLEVFERPEYGITDAVAVRLADGAAYTLYLADHELDRDQLDGATTPGTGDGELLVVITITTAAPDGDVTPVEAGEVIEAGEERDGRRFTLLADRAGQLYSSAPAPSGEVEVLELDDASMCVAIDYTDLEQAVRVDGELQDAPVQKRLAGTVVAEVVEGPF